MIEYNSCARGEWGSNGHRNPVPEEVVAFIKKQVEALDNRDLLDEYTSFAGGDDYDGCYTWQGRKVYELLGEELFSRLRNHGFLEE